MHDDSVVDGLGHGIIIRTHQLLSFDLLASFLNLIKAHIQELRLSTALQGPTAAHIYILTFKLNLLRLKFMYQNQVRICLFVCTCEWFEFP